MTNLYAALQHEEDAMALYDLFVQQVGQAYVKDALADIERRYDAITDNDTGDLGSEFMAFATAICLATAVDWLHEKKHKDS